MTQMYQNFTNQYPLSKVLRFSLLPQGKTKENIEKNQLIEADECRAEDYKTVKKLIDQYHKVFIDRVLSGVSLKGLDDYQAFYQCSERDHNQDTAFDELKSQMRKTVSQAFKNDEEYKGLFGKEIITKYLPNYLQDEDEKRLVESFNKFTTYFSGFFQNRENMYTDEDQATAICHRIVTQNLPKAMDNIRVFQIIRNHPNLYQQIKAAENELDQFMEGSWDDVFTSEYYNHMLTNEGIQEYNTLLGGYVDDEQRKIRGLNEYINLYNQKLPKGEKKIPKAKLLYKQILADQESASFIIEQLNSDQDVLDAVRQTYSCLKEELLYPKNGMSMQEALSSWTDYDLGRVFIRNGQCLSQISQQMYDSWTVITSGLYKVYDESYTGKIKNREIYEEKRKDSIKKTKAYSINELNVAVSKAKEPFEPVQEFFSQIGYKENLLEKTDAAYKKAEELLWNDYPEKKQLKKDADSIELIKNLMDAMLGLQQLLKMFYVPEAEKDERFYYELDRMQMVLNSVVPVYNQVRNYVTGKPYSIEKFKLNFGNPQLLGGWDKNKEKDYWSVILRKDGKYYLGIMHKDYKDVFLDDNIPKLTSESNYEKMEYKLLPGPNKMLPKVFFSKSRIEEFAPSEEVLSIRNKKSFKKGEKFSKSDCHKMIDFFKRSIAQHEDWSKFDFQFSDTASYEDISGFYREVEQQNYKLSFVSIPEYYIDQLIEEGKFYLFQIYNKDFSKHSHGRKNLHTVYWEMLFDPRNLADVVYKLNGEAEMFYRKASLPVQVTHPANVPIDHKIPNEDGSYGQSCFCYDLIKDRRYTVDKFQFHVSISMNYKAQGKGNIDEYARQILHNQKGTYAIGIDRGERNLLYLCVVDPEGNIVHQESMNSVGSDGNKQDYHRLLCEREHERDLARKNWQTIEGIKELKEGYLSQVIHRITQLMVRYDAILVLEDLNFGFMRGRQKVERQVYQKFEKMLIDKLNYLVDKGLDPNEYGGSLNAYQLTSKFSSFQKLGKQSGLVFYIPAWNTSKIDPTTGFVNLLHPKYSNVSEARVFFSNFEKIFYDSKNDYFVFAFDYERFTEKAAGTKTNWEICTFGERIENYRNPEKNNNWDYRIVDLTQEMKDLLEEYQIAYQNGEDLVDIISNSDMGDKKFYQRMVRILRLTLQMRNSITNSEEDYLISPVKNKKGEFFSTKDAPDYLPKDADGNGAFNIARKGLWALEQIRSTDETELKKVKLAISNKEWLSYAQTHTVM